MKHIKRFTENINNPDFSEATQLIQDYRTEFTDLGYEVSSPQISKYQICGSKFIDCLIFGISTESESQLMLQDCYNGLEDLRSHLGSLCKLDLSIEIHSELPLLSLEDAHEVYASVDWQTLVIFIHAPFNRSEIDLEN